MNDETLKEQIENCFIINNMCDCVDEHTSLNLDDLDKRNQAQEKESDD